MLWRDDWCLYDIPNEHVMYCDTDYDVTDAQHRNNVIKMPVSQARLIRHAKNLPMPSPPIEVVYAPGAE